ncbi:penicillin-binding protein 2 [bacterium]|nr:penicillin-binding protein 2 [bacterium]
MNERDFQSSAASRFWLFRCVALAVFAILAFRASYLHLFAPSGKNLQALADRQYQLHEDLSPYRGGIFDRREEPLAISIRTPSLAVNPRVFNPDQRQTRTIAKILGTTQKDVQQISSKRGYFAWLQRQVHHKDAARIMALGIPGIHEITESARYYPAGPAAAHLLGYVGLDNRGLHGLELFYDRELRGQSQRIKGAKDARGRRIFTGDDQAEPELPGHSLHLTLDRVIQEIAEEAVRAGAERAKAKGAFALVSDPHTGKILAVANHPSFDPNDFRQVRIDQTRNSALLDQFEPGSIIKPFVIAGALEQKKVKADDVFDCENGLFNVGGVTFHDDHPAGLLTVSEALVRSSNICTYKVAEKLGRKAFHENYLAFGFNGNIPGAGRDSSSGPPAAEGNEQNLRAPPWPSGRVSNYEKWLPIRFANIAFGQGMTTTGLEIVQAYGAIANGGNLMRPTLIDRIESADGNILASFHPEVVRRVISPDVANTMRKMLASVVTHKNGTGSKAKTASYTVAGKTGTAQKVDPVRRTYSPDKRIASFVGFAPVEDPYLVILVVIDEPRERPAYGGLWAAPVFSEIAQKSLKYLNVAPDLEDNKLMISAGEPAVEPGRL